MTYYGSQMVVKNYNIMGVAKAALECAVRYIAAELGPKGIRVHAISPGPLATRAASGIPEFDELLDKAQSKAPARSLVSIDDVGKATAFLALDAARLITGRRSTSTAAITSLIDFVTWLRLRPRPINFARRVKCFFGLAAAVCNCLRKSPSKENVMKNFCINTALVAVLVGVAGFSTPSRPKPAKLPSCSRKGD